MMIQICRPSPNLFEDRQSTSEKEKIPQNTKNFKLIFQCLDFDE